MKIALVHNRYQQHGGEDQVFVAERSLLEAHGHRLLQYTMDNDRIAGMNPLSLARDTVWSNTVYREMRTLIRRELPQVVHFHNTFPLISPAAYYAARAEGLPMVQHLHNYRLLCPNALLFRDGRVCEDCLGKAVPMPGVVHACYRNSRTATAPVAAMLAVHNTLGTWSKTINTYIALSEFAREKFVQGGLPAEKVVVKPNFIYSDPGLGEGRGKYILFVGRLSREKGVDTLLAAWERLRKNVQLKIVGDGPLASKAEKATKRFSEINWLGTQPQDRVFGLMKDAQALIIPSVCYENFPMVLVEAYAAGLPVIASDLGSMSSLIDHGRTGLHFRPGDPEDLAARIEWSSTHPVEFSHMRREARAAFEAKYTAERNYEMLMNIYELALKSHASHAEHGRREHDGAHH